MSEFRRRLNENGAKIFWSQRPDSEVSFDVWARDAVSQADIVIVNGEGSIHHSAKRARARNLAEVAVIARDSGVPAFLLNATIHEIDASTANSLKAFTSIFVRESESQRELASCGVPSVVVPDVTIGADFSAAAGARKGVCAGDSVIQEVRKAIVARCRREGWSYKPMRRSGFAHLLPSTPQRYAKFLSSHSLAVTGRFHGVAFCLATRTPFVAMESNTPKIGSTVHDALGSTRRVLTMNEIAACDLSPFQVWEKEEEELLHGYLADTRAAIEAMFSVVCG